MPRAHPPQTFVPHLHLCHGERGLEAEGGGQGGVMPKCVCSAGSQTSEAQTSLFLQLREKEGAGDGEKV